MTCLVRPPKWRRVSLVLGNEGFVDLRKAILDLYVEQRAGVYKGGITATPVESIRFVRPDVAIVNSRFRLTGLHASDGSILPVRRGLLTLLVTKEQGHWLITSMRGIPETPTR